MISFDQWMQTYPAHKYTETTISRYKRALTLSGEWLGISFTKPILDIFDLVEFQQLKNRIINDPNYDEVNRKHGHGDLSAGLSAYEKYLTSIQNATVSPADLWKPSIDIYSPNLSKEDWLALLSSPNIILKEWKEVLAMFFLEKDGISCLSLAGKYSRSSESIGGICMKLGKRIHKETSCPLYYENGMELYWPILFQGKKPDSMEKGTYIWKLRSELYDALMDFNIIRFLPENTELSVKDKFDLIKKYIASRGFTYEDGLIENFYLSLKSKPFVILAGASGTGKTRLVRLFAEAIGATAENGRYKLVSVRPDWSDSSDLFGHTNLKGEFVPGAIIDFVKDAADHTDKPYFLCLDEMNLARVEYYLSDFLSVIETRHRAGDSIVTDEIILDSAARERYGKVSIPENLYVIGTVNMDETTFPFSKKVLDRANTIEFSYVDLEPDFSDALDPTDPVALSLDNDFLKTQYLILKSDIAAEDRDLAVKVCSELQSINQILLRANAHVGYRVRDEIVFYMVNNKAADLLDDDEALDNEIMQKILPRIQGSSASVRDLLCELFKKCAGDYTGLSQASVSEQMKAYIDTKECIYPKSAEKITYMMRRYEEDGFTSYWL